MLKSWSKNDTYAVFKIRRSSLIHEERTEVEDSRPKQKHRYSSNEFAPTGEIEAVLSEETNQKSKSQRIL